MRRLSLSTLLIAINVGLVLIAVVWVAGAAVTRLERLSDDQALARAGIAGAAVERAVQQMQEEVATAAHLLAERPTLTRLVEAGDTEGVRSFLDRFRATTRLSGCAVVPGHGAVVASGAAPLPDVAAGSGATTPSDCGARLRRRPSGGLTIESVCAVRSLADTRVVATLSLDDEAARQVAARAGLPVTLLEKSASMEQEDDPRYELRTRCLTSGAAVAQRLDAAGVYLELVPLRDLDGEVVGLAETSLAIASIAAPLRQLVRSLVLATALVLVLVAGLSVLVARWLARPIETLTGASARIGAGDLSTPIPRAGRGEVGVLAEGMEEMRGRLLQLEARLSRRQADAEAVLTGIAEGVFSVDRERRIRYLNPQAAALLQTTPEEAVGRFCGDVLSPLGTGGERPCETSCPIVHARFGGRSRSTEHLSLPGGRRRIVVITSAATETDPRGESDPADAALQFQVIRDETELEATRRLRDVVLSNISHEFKTPLTAQLASIELLAERLGEPRTEEAAQTAMLVQSLQRGTLRLTQLIDNLLESVRLEAGERSIRRRPLALDEVLEEAIELTAPLIAHRRQTLAIDLPYPMPHVLGDAARLTQVFVNLVANANKFAPEDSSIRIGGAVDAASVTVWVEDEGPGLRASMASRLFERFVRTAERGEEGEPEQSGMGLGLSIVKSIVDRHGGRVEARAGLSAGRGTRMCIVLPRESEDAA